MYICQSFVSGSDEDHAAERIVVPVNVLPF